jgi:hypothetical protein
MIVKYKNNLKETNITLQKVSKMGIIKKSKEIIIYQDVVNEGKPCKLEIKIKIRTSITGKPLAQIVSQRFIPMENEK